MASILRQGIALSAARYFEQVIMLLTPVVLVRTIDPTAFGEYRLFWLLVITVAVLFPFDMPRSLLFFFPRLEFKGAPALRRADGAVLACHNDDCGASDFCLW